MLHREKIHWKGEEKEDYSGFLETMYHAMNLNSFIVDGNMYDTSFLKIDPKLYKMYNFKLLWYLQKEFIVRYNNDKHNRGR